MAVCSILFPIGLPPFSSEANMIEEADSQGRDVLIAYTYFLQSPYVLMVIKPRGEVFKSWYTLKTEIFYVFVVAVCIIFLVIFKLTDLLVQKNEGKREKDAKRLCARWSTATNCRPSAGWRREWPTKSITRWLS